MHPKIGVGPNSRARTSARYLLSVRGGGEKGGEGGKGARSRVIKAEEGREGRKRGGGTAIDFYCVSRDPINFGRPIMSSPTECFSNFFGGFRGELYRK